ncbi:MAG: hypothetical protein EOP92_21150 [Lysobacteraceae bacterium]|nr:MAG: hypothetical protein EOP92_21150 [Xanthomonadaceae bacterium]
MDPMKLLRSLEEFLFEAIALLFFYPVTFFRILFKPLATMRYAESEERMDQEGRYNAAVSPPLLLVLTLVLANFIGVAAHAPQPQSAGPFAKMIFDSPQYLVLFRGLLFSLLPLVGAVTLLGKQNVAVSRNALRPYFFAQCYLTVPFTLFMTLGGIGIARGEGTPLLMGTVICIACCLWLITVQALWFKAKLSRSLLASVLTALGVFFRAALYLVLVAVLVNWL